MEWNLSCLSEARSMTLAVTAFAIILAEGRTVDEIALLSNLFNGVSAQLGILASFDCQAQKSTDVPPAVQ